MLAAENEEEKREWLQILVEKIDESSIPNLFQKSKTLITAKPNEKEKEEILEVISILDAI